MFARNFLMLVLSTLALTLLLSVQAAFAGDNPGIKFLAIRRPGGRWQLTQSEIEGLSYMREEEKLAHDSYLTLYAKWHLPIFSNAASREVAHMSRVKDLLDRYGLADPADGKAVGEFSNADLQQQYDDLMVQGSQSSIEALKVGAAIEEADISDLQRCLETTTRTDITKVFSSLKSASYSHWRAFSKQLGQ
jgi:hypothetical protein